MVVYWVDRLNRRAGPGLITMVEAAVAQNREKHNPILADQVELELNRDPNSEDEDISVRHTSFNAVRDGIDPHFHVWQKFGTKK